MYRVAKKKRRGSITKKPRKPKSKPTKVIPNSRASSKPRKTQAKKDKRPGRGKKANVTRVSKAQKTKEFKKRSKASKLGHARRKEREKGFATRLDILHGPLTEIEDRKLRIAELRKLPYGELEDTSIYYEDSRYGLKLTRLEYLEGYVSRSGRVCSDYSRIRHFVGAEDILLRLEDAAGFDRGTKDVDMDDEFVETIEDIANEYDIPLRELYTLWFSP